MPSEALLLIVPALLLAVFLFTVVLMGALVPELAVNWRYWTSTGKWRVFSFALVVVALVAAMRVLGGGCTP